MLSDLSSDANISSHFIFFSNLPILELDVEFFMILYIFYTISVSPLTIWP